MPIRDGVRAETPTNSGGGAPAALRFSLGEWRQANIAANFNTGLSRGTGQAAAAQIPYAASLIGFTLSMSNTGLVVPAAGSALLVKIIQTDVDGTVHAAVTIGTIAIGEANVSRAITPDPINFLPGSHVQVLITTDGSWTGTTCSPAVTLDFEAL